MTYYFINIGNVEFQIHLKDTFTAREIKKNIPLKGNCKKWGKEFYFYTKLNIPLEIDAKQIVRLGEIAYWPSGGAIAVGFGPTPISSGSEIKLVEKCNIWAYTTYDLKKLETLVCPKEILINSK